MAHDVVSFLSWAAEAVEITQADGVKVMIFR